MPAPTLAFTKGKINTSSTSKIKKTKAIKKNRKEKGIREAFLGLNPHSNGLVFSRSKANFFARPSPNKLSKPPNTKTITR